MLDGQMGILLSFYQLQIYLPEPIGDCGGMDVDMEYGLILPLRRIVRVSCCPSEY